MKISIPCFWTLLSTLITVTVQISSPDADSYVAAVVEYAAIGDALTEEPLDIIRRNWQNYRNLIHQAAEQNVDIIVFPECGLTTMNLPANRTTLPKWLVQIPEPSSKEIPCIGSPSDVPEILRNASCAARDYGLYLVINLSEKAPCSSRDPSCPADGIYIYNSNVVFDRNGTVVARYRKFNLFVEPSFDVTPTAELSTFDTDFGVRFGTFICFDILFQKPALQLVEELGITDFVYPTAWFSELPYLTAAETQAAWAYALDVNLLTSGFSNPPNGNVGSGIYAGKLGPLDVTMPSTRSIKLLIRTVPKKPSRKPVPQDPPSTASPGDFPAPLPLSEVPISIFSGIRFFQDDFRQYKTELLNTDSSQFVDIDLCHGEFCCHFEISTNITRNGVGDSCETEGCGGYYYRLGVFDGIRNFAGISVAGVQVCGIIPCTKKNDITTCGKARDSSYPPDDVKFNSIFIRGNKFQKYSSLQMPTTLTESLLPLPSSDFLFSVIETPGQDKNTVELRTTKEVDNLVGLALYGRAFDRDGPTQPQPTTTSGSTRSL